MLRRVITTSAPRACHIYKRFKTRREQLSRHLFFFFLLSGSRSLSAYQPRALTVTTCRHKLKRWVKRRKPAGEYCRRKAVYILMNELNNLKKSMYLACPEIYNCISCLSSEFREHTPRISRSYEPHRCLPYFLCSYGNHGNVKGHSPNGQRSYSRHCVITCVWPVRPVDTSKQVSPQRLELWNFVKRWDLLPCECLTDSCWQVAVDCPPLALPCVPSPRH